MVVPEPVSARAAEQGSDRASSTHPRLLQPIVPCSQGNRGVEADLRSVLPQCLRALPELHYGDLGQSSGPYNRASGLKSLDLKDSYFHIGIDPADRRYLRVLSQRHRLAVYSTAIRVVNQSESIYKILKPVLAFAHLHRVKIAHVHRRLVVKPRDTPGSSRANILAQVPVPKARVGFLNLEKSDLF